MIPLVTAEDRSYDIRAKPIVGGGRHVVYLQFPPFTKHRIFWN